MAIARITRISGAISLLITIFSLSLPAYAQYSSGTGEPNDPYQIATAEDLMLLGETPEDYDKHFILTADIDLSQYPYDIGLHFGQFCGIIYCKDMGAGGYENDNDE